MPDLYSDHEEAETKQPLHAKHAAADSQSVFFKSPDTDVLVLAVAHASEIEVPLFLSMGSASIVNNVCPTAVRGTIGDSVGNALIGMHCFTGCDSVSAFQRNGKKFALDLIRSSAAVQSKFTDLASCWNRTQ